MPPTLLRPAAAWPFSVCRQCRRSLAAAAAAAEDAVPTMSRRYSSNSSSRKLVTQGSVARLSSRRLLSVAGPDAEKYLQGAMTANIMRLHNADNDGADATVPGLYAAFLTAQGRVLHDVFVYRDTLGGSGSGFLIEVDADEATALAAHIRRYKLRAKFNVRLLDDGEVDVWHAWGAAAAEAANAAAAAATAGGPGVITLADTRAPGLGWRLVAPGTATMATAMAAAATDELAYRVHRYGLGVAEGQREILRGQALPLESNMDVMGGIDFHKGCYVGQELTIRTRHRGVVRKRILPCVVMGDDATEADRGQSTAEAPIYDPHGPAAAIPAETSIGRAGKKGRSAGKWLRGVGNLGLALCRLETMTDIVLPGEAAASTFDAATEFVMRVAEPGAGNAEKEDGSGAPDGSAQTVKVRAFVPEWLRQRLSPETP